MKNKSDEIIMDGNNPSFFPKITQNQPNLDDSKKNNIIASSELKNSLTKPEFNKYTFKSTKMKIISIIIYFIVIIGLELLYRDYLFNKSVSLQEKIHLNPKSDLLLKIGKIISFFAANMAAFIFVFFNFFIHAFKLLFFNVTKYYLFSLFH